MWSRVQGRKKAATLSVLPRSPIVREVLRSPGEPLASSTRGTMESLFSDDFNRVRVHADRPAADAPRAVDADAFTVGDHVVFAAGRFSPRTSAGRRLLVHELTHVIQQEVTPETVVRPSELSSDRDPAEREAREIAVGVGRQAPVQTASRLQQPSPASGPATTRDRGLRS